MKTYAREPRMIEIDRRLLALPYKIELTPQGSIIMTPHDPAAPDWDQLATTHPILPEDFPWKVETNAQRQIIMSPPPHVDHQLFDEEIRHLLRTLMPGGRPVSCPGLKTANGVRIPDVAWASDERHLARGSNPSFELAPEICVEILSPSNSRREIDEKEELYFQAGALECWRCERSGKMLFSAMDGALKKSRLCPEFPSRIKR